MNKAASSGLWTMHRLVTLYHNPACAASRAALDVLTSKGVSVKMVEYMKQPPTPAHTKDLLKQMGITDPRQIMRRDDHTYRSLNLDSPNVSHQELIDAICEHPWMLQRPIVSDGQRAVIADRPERALDLLDDATTAAKSTQSASV